MISSRFDPKSFFQRAENVALRVAADEIFGLLRRSLDLPGAWGALVHRSSGAREVVRAGGVVEGADAEDVLFVRCSPLELEFVEEELASSDSFVCRAEASLRLRVIPESGDLSSFAHAVLGSQRFAQTSGLIRFLRPVLRSALMEFARSRLAEALCAPDGGDEAANVVAAAVEPACFAAGLCLEGRPVVRFDSASLQAVRRSREEAVRAQAEHEAARDLRRAIEQAQRAHLSHLVDVLGRLSELAKASPAVALGDLIRTFSEAERGELYDALFAEDVAGPRTRWIVVIAGDDLLFFDPANLERPVRTVRLVGEVGRIRSIQAVDGEDGTPRLWVGAERGVYGLSEDGSAIELTLAVPDAGAVRGGFNSVAVVGDRVIASHSELGLWQWEPGNAGSPQPLLTHLTERAKTVRCVQAYDGWLYCAIDHRVVRRPVERSDGELVMYQCGVHSSRRLPVEVDRSDAKVVMYQGGVSTVTALHVAGDDVYAGNADGDVLRWAKGRCVDPERLYMGTQRAVESIATLETHGVKRLFFTDTSPRVHGRVVGDRFTRFYEAGGQTIRRVEVARDLIVGTNELRDRLLCWRVGSPNDKPRVTSIGALTGHSVQDVCLISHAG